MPKPGWDIEIIRGTYAAPQQQGGTTIAEGVTELRWSGTLPVAFYDEFFFRARLADGVTAGTKIWFPVIQECAVGLNRWITQPVDGQPEPDEPTPGFEVTDPVADAGH